MPSAYEFFGNDIRNNIKTPHISHFGTDPPPVNEEETFLNATR